MPLRLYNSGSLKKEVFRPLRKGEISIYVCGITPYDTTHLGHAFTYLSFDALIRYLRFKGFTVTYTQNVTDIDDDILKRAREQDTNWMALGNLWTDRFLKDMKRLNMDMPEHYVRATESIPKITEMVSVLLKKGFAYKKNGNVYFDTSKFRSYGNLSHFNERQMEMLLKERGGNPGDPNKRNRLDFILWQRWKSGEPYWNAPFGKGRPGWHIECSAMINQYLGERIDIHGGGRDLVFPHHESEIAQSESYTGKRPFSRYFMHTGMVVFMGEKMAKSLGNLVMVSDLLRRHSPSAVRWLILSHHYRKVWEYYGEEMDGADVYARKVDGLMKGKADAGMSGVDRRIVSEFETIMDDDMNTPAALEMLGKMLIDGKEKDTVRYLLSVLGF